MPDTGSDPFELIPNDVYKKITEVRVADSSLARQLAKRRVRRHTLTDDGKLTLLAADHPARMVTGIRGDPLRMGRRRELLSRIHRVLAASEFDGLLGTADIIDELLMIQQLTQGKKTGFLNRKVMIGSVNRGGLVGSAFELDDRVTGYDVEGILSMNLDGAKFLLRFDPESRDSALTLGYCLETLRMCDAHDLPLFIEPLPARWKDGKVVIEKEPEKLIRLVGAVSALGSSSMNIWLKLPFTNRFDEVAGSTTLPILLLGGEASDDLGGLLRDIEEGLSAGSNVRGVMMGRNLLYPPGDDPLPLAKAVHSLVHDGMSAKDAAAILAQDKPSPSIAASND